MTETAERIDLASRPVGEPTLDDFRLDELPIPKPGPGHMLLRTLWLSLDPYASWNHRTAHRSASRYGLERYRPWRIGGRSRQPLR